MQKRHNDENGERGNWPPAIEWEEPSGGGFGKGVERKKNSHDAALKGTEPRWI